MSTQEIIHFYQTHSAAQLIEKADQCCRQHYQDKIYLRGLIEFSNYCQCDCLYCGIRKSNRKVNRYRLTDRQIINAVSQGFEKGIKTFVLQSGEDPHYDTRTLCRLIENIKDITRQQAAITLSIGIKSKKVYQELKAAGADRFLIRFETGDEKLHHYLRNGQSLKRRLTALTDLRECGYEVGSGYMVGLPGETEQIRINNALLAHKLDLHMIGIGPFIPHPDTPLKNSHCHSIELALKATALIRLLLPKANIPATTAIGSLEDQGREKALQAGANVLMPNLTPLEVKKDYLLYPGKICLDENGLQCLSCLSQRTQKINKQISLERGDSLAKTGQECNYA